MTTIRATVFLRRLVVTGLVLGLVGLLALFVVGGITAVQVPRAIEYGEPFIVSAAWYLGTGGTLYAPVDDLPFLHNNYNPLVQSLVAPLLATTGVSYAPLRAVTFISTLLLLFALFFAVRSETGSAVAGMVGGLLPLSCGFVFPWLCVGRVDVFALLFSTLGLLWAYRFSEASAAKRSWFLLFAWIAFAAKQSVVGGALAVCLYALVRGRVKEAFGFGALYLAGCFGLLGVFNLLTGGQHWLHAIGYNASHDRGAFWPETLPPLQMLEAVGYALALLFLATLVHVRWRQDARWICWLVVAFPLAFVLVRKSGSHMHYLLETVCALSVLGTVVGFRVLRASQGVAATACVALVALALIPGTPITVPREWRTGAWWKAQQVRGLFSERDLADWVPAEVRQRIKASDRSPLLLAKTASIAVECGVPAIFDVGDFARLQQLGLWSAKDRLLPLVRERRFPVIAFQEFVPGFSDQGLFAASAIDGLEEAVRADYRLLARARHPKGWVVATFWVPRE